MPEFVMTIGDVGEQAEEEPILEEDLLLQSYVHFPIKDIL